MLGLVQSHPQECDMQAQQATLLIMIPRMLRQWRCVWRQALCDAVRISPAESESALLTLARPPDYSTAPLESRRFVLVVLARAL